MTGAALGVTLPQFTNDPAVLLDAARRAEELELDSIWLFDHLWPLTGGKQHPVIEAWTALSWLVAATRKVRIGTLVTRSTLRHPALAAKMAATVAAMAPGRLVVGVGSGDSLSRDENVAFGLPYHSGPARLRQLTGAVEAMARAWDEPVASPRGGRSVSLWGLPTSPRPAARPELWIGGRSPGTVALAARVADGWNAWGSTPERFAADAARLARAAGERLVTPTWGGVVVLEDTDDAARYRVGAHAGDLHMVGGPRSVARHLRALEDAGARHLVVTLPDAGRVGGYERLGNDVRAHMRSSNGP